MATTTREDFAGTGRLPQGLVYPQLSYSAYVETIQQNTAAFNQQSRNCIVVRAEQLLGDFSQEGFFGLIGNLVQRRNVDSSPQNPAVTSLEIPMEEHISVKLNRRIGPVEWTHDAARKQGRDPSVFATAVAIQAAKAQMVDYLDSSLIALQAALSNQAALSLVPSPQVGLTTDNLFDALSLFGDQSGRIKLWVMHSSVWHQFTKGQYAQNILGVADVNVSTGMPLTLDRPVLVTDSTALVSGNTYYTLGLTEGAAEVIVSEPSFSYQESITGYENIVDRWQGEAAYNLKLKGFKWDVANGGVGPDATALGTGTNWDNPTTDSKNLGGVVITHTL